MKFRNWYMIWLHMIGIPLMCAATILFSVLFVSYPFQSLSDRMICAFAAGLGWIGSIGMLVTARQKGCATFYIDSRGITNSYIFGRDIFIAWSDCTIIGAAFIAFGRGAYHNPALYFSKKPLSHKQLRWLKNNKDHMWLVYTDKVLEEVLKHVDKKRIRGLGQVRNRR